MKRQADAVIPTPWGNFLMAAYAHQAGEQMPHLALIHEDFDPTHTTLTRLHSECLTGDIFGSHRCDCGEQLHESMRQVAENAGIVLYLRQEGRGIGLINKLKAYRLQDKGTNTAAANLHLGFAEDARDYSDAIAILKDIGATKIRLLTNNPLKMQALEGSSIEVVERVPLLISPRPENDFYLHTKQNLMGHLLNL